MRKRRMWKCKDDCPECEGDVFIVVGSEGFINSRLEQDVRDLLDPCPNAEFIEPEEE